MIVRNEASIIERCLASALPLIDAAVICDTGSTDDTAERAAGYLRAAGVTRRVISHPWRNFGENRTRAIAEARALALALSWPLHDTYWLFLDADLELQQSTAFRRALLQGPGLLVRQRSRSLSCWNLRFANGAVDWRAEGPTHERYVSSAMSRLDRLDGLWIRDHTDGDSRVEKFARDVDWLSTRLDESPDDSRTIFYLAQSYRGLGDPLKALLLYRRRAAFGDAHPECWYSQWMSGRILAEGENGAAATIALRAAHEANPARAEPLYELARLFRSQGRFEEAAEHAARGLCLPVPLDQQFVHCDIYEYGLELELGRSAMHTSHPERGAVACDRLVRRRSLPDTVREEARQLQLHYAAPLAGVQYLPVRPGLVPPHYRPCNPSLLRTEEGYLVCCRTVNYTQRRLTYRSLDADGVYRTANVLLRFDRDWRLLGEHEIGCDDPPLRETRVRGFEDCRLVQAGGALYMTCATADRHPGGSVHQSVCRLRLDGRTLVHSPLIGRFDTRPQKNWLPFCGPDGRLRAVYSYDPLIVLRLDAESGRYDVDDTVPATIDARSWRGSGGPVSTPSGEGRRLLMVHDVVHRQGPDQGWERVYLHRFVEYDPAFHLGRVSAPFVFAHKGIEFVCGMALSHDGDELLIGVGIEDRDAYIARIPWSRVESLLQAP